jgi:CIC family chloride channel protein
MKKKLNFFNRINRVITDTPVSEIMVTYIKTLHEKDNVQKAIDMMAQYSISGLLVVNGEGYPLGIVTEGDIIKKVLHKNKDAKKIFAKEIMTPHLFTIKPGQSIGETAEQMKRHNVSKFPVVENNKLLGIVTKADLLEKLNEIYYQNTRLKWLPLVMLIQLIAIAVLILMYVNK